MKSSAELRPRNRAALFRALSSFEAAVGTASWNAVLSTFNSVVRSYLRGGSAPPTVAPFYGALADARRHCSNLSVALILEEVWEARDLIGEYPGSTPVELRGWQLQLLCPRIDYVEHAPGRRPVLLPARHMQRLSTSVCNAIVETSRAPQLSGRFRCLEPI
jgi:hypothetical protein